MDHLPEIENLAYPLPKIPCFCRPEDYDGHGVRDFPARSGWTLDEEKGPSRIADHTTLIESPNAMLQAWLYFGVLHDVLSIGGLNVKMQDFMQTINGELFVTSRPLRDYIKQLAQNADGMTEEECRGRQERASDCLGFVGLLLNFFWNPSSISRRWSISSHLPLDVVMSIQILIETFKDLGLRIWTVSANPSPLHSVFARRAVNPLVSRLQERNWCPSEIRLLFDLLDLTGVHLASLLRRPYAQGLSHKRCSDQECLALQTSETDYTTIHADDCPGETACTDIVIDQSKISNIYRMGGMPIIDVRFASDGTPKVRILDFYSNTVEYVAISHVWAHGRGNPRENALPSCQLLRLKHLSAGINRTRYSDPAFWIDTLCVPVASEYRIFRKAAIRNLAATYREASQVLVLDADLQRIPRLSGKTELATRILCSGWMRRLWTLQEAVMMSDRNKDMSNVQIECLDGPKQLNEILISLLPNKVRYHTISAVSNLYYAFPSLQARGHTFNMLAHSLRYRMTSRKEDEAICVASILGLSWNDISQILEEISAEARMQKLFTYLAQIPASVLFHKWRRLTHEGAFRWAPASLLSGPIQVLLGPIARCDVRGLHVQFAGFSIISLPAYTSESFSYDDSKKDWVMNEDFPNGGYYIGDSTETFPKAEIRRDITDAPSHHASDFAAFHQLFKDMKQPAIIINPKDLHRSVLVSVTNGQEESGVIEAIWIKTISFFDFRSGTDDLRKKRFETNEINWKAHLIDVKELPSEQRWCIR